MVGETKKEILDVHGSCDYLKEEGAGIPVETVQAIFGPGMIVTGPYISGHRNNFQEAINIKPGKDKLSRKKITYVFDTPRSNISLSFLISGEGEVKQFHFEGGEKRGIDTSLLKVVEENEPMPCSGELCSKIKEPTPFTEFLTNLKYMLENGLLVREDFYQDAILMRLFGGWQVEWFRNDKTDKRAHICGPSFLQGVNTGPTCYGGMGVHWFGKGKYTQSEKRCSLGTVDADFPHNNRERKIHASGGSYEAVRNPGFTADKVVTIFGKTMHVTPSNLNSSYFMFNRPGDHELGRKNIGYVIDKPGTLSCISFETLENGEVISFGFEQEEK